MTKAEKPLAVTVLSLLFGIMCILDAVRFFFPPLFSRTSLSTLRLSPVGIVLLIFVIIDFVIAYELWAAKRWAWMTAIGYAALRMIIAVVSLFLRPGSGQIVSLVLCLLVLYYLIHPQVQTFYGRSNPNSGALSARRSE